MAIEVQEWIGRPHTFLFPPPIIPEIIKAVVITDEIPNGKNGKLLRVIFWKEQFEINAMVARMTDGEWDADGRIFNFAQNSVDCCDHCYLWHLATEYCGFKSTEEFLGLLLRHAPAL